MFSLFLNWFIYWTTFTL